MDARQQVGARGESAAAAFLEGHGFEVVARNVRYREGELDLVCTRDNTLVVVEVKTRRSARQGTGAEAVTARKQARIRRATMRFLNSSDVRWAALRFDVLELNEFDGTYRIRHIQSAF